MSADSRARGHERRDDSVKRPEVTATTDEAADRGEPMPASRTAVALLLAYVAILPVSWTPLPLNIQIADVLFLPLLSATLLLRRRWRLAPLDAAVAGVFAASLLSLSHTASLSLSLVQIARQSYLIALYGVTAALVGGDLPLGRVGRWFAITATVVAGVSLVAVAAYYVAGRPISALGAAMPMPYIGRLYRLYGPFPSPEYFANFLAFCLPLALVFTIRRGPLPRARWWMAAVVMVVAAGFTAGHSVAGLLVGAVVLLAREQRAKRPVMAAAAVAVAVAVVVVVNAALIVVVRDVAVTRGIDSDVHQAAFSHASQRQGAAPTISARLTYDVMAYWLLKRLALDAFHEAPWTGIGIGTFHLQSQQAAADGRLPPDFRGHDPHSTWFGGLAETGVVGVVALAVLWGGVLLHAVRLSARGGPQAEFAAALAAGLTGILVNSLNVDVMNFRFVWLAFGAVRAYSLI